MVYSKENHSLVDGQETQWLVDFANVSAKIFVFFVVFVSQGSTLGVSWRRSEGRRLLAMFNGHEKIRRYVFERIHLWMQKTTWGCQVLWRVSVQEKMTGWNEPSRSRRTLVDSETCPRQTMEGSQLTHWDWTLKHSWWHVMSMRFLFVVGSNSLRKEERNKAKQHWLNITTMKSRRSCRYVMPS